MLRTFDRLQFVLLSGELLPGYVHFRTFDNRDGIKSLDLSSTRGKYSSQTDNDDTDFFLPNPDCFRYKTSSLHHFLQRAAMLALQAPY